MIKRRNQHAVILHLAVAGFLGLHCVLAQASIVIGPVSNPPPSISTQPKSVTVVQGASATFDVTASGLGPYYYQWRFETINIVGATNSSFTLSNAQPANVGKYSVEVRNNSASVISANAALTVNVPPTISEQPKDVIVNVGADASFSVVASSPEPLGFQWRFNGTNISGATDSSFTRFNVQTNDAGNYSVTVTNPAASVLSANALLSVVTNSLYWDINGTNAGAGSTSGTTRPNGAWTNSFWSLSSEGDAPTTDWRPGATAIFSAGTNATRNFTVSLTQDESVGGLIFEEGLVTVSGTNRLNFTGVADITVSSNRSATLLTPISGNAGLVKNGSGFLGLVATNPLAGPVQINEGVLSIAQAAALGTGSEPITINGATLSTTATGTKEFVDSDRPIQIGLLDATIDVAGSNTVSTYDGVISGEGRTLFKTGPGDFRSRSNTFARLVVNDGTYRVRTGGKETAFGAVPTNFVRNALTVNGGAIGTAVAITTPANRGIRLGSGNGIFILNQHWTIDSEISGPGGLIKDAGGASFVLSLNASNSYAGRTVINSGIMAITNDNALGTAPASNVVDQLSFDGGRLKTSGDFSINTNRGIVLETNGGTFDVTNNLDYYGLISGPGSLTKIGSGKLRIGKTNTYSGGTTLTNGILEVPGNASLGSGSVVIYGGAISSSSWQANLPNSLKISGNITLGYPRSVAAPASFEAIPNKPLSKNQSSLIEVHLPPLPPLSGNLDFSGNVDLGSGVSKSITNNAYTIFSGSLTNSAGFVKAGLETLALAGANSYQGSTEISEGFLSISADQNLGAVPSSPISSNIVLRGGTLQASSTFALHANRGVLLQNDGGAIYVNLTNTLTLPGQITGVGGIAKNGPGTLVLAGANNFFGPTIISDGTLQLNSSERIPNNSAVVVSSDATFDLNDWTETIGSLSGSGLVRLGNGTLIIGGDNSDTIFSGTITGIGNIVKIGSGTLTLSGSNEFTGGITVEGGNVKFVSPLTLEVIGNGSVTPNPNGERLEIGATFSITATPGQNYFFSHWSGGIDSTNAQLTFVMQSNLVLQAHFLRVPSIYIKGTYNGLFSENEGVRQPSAGFFSCKISSAGVFSGKVLVDGGSHSFNGRLDSNHAAQVEIPRRGKTILNLNFQADPDSEQITGTVQTSDWISTLLADRAFADSSSEVATQAGKHTMAISRGNDASVSPGGDGFATLTILKNGSLRMSGVLADNTRIAQSVSLSKDGQWPLYVPLYRGNGSILSWISFIDQDTSNLQGNLNWIKSSAALGQFYRAGFSNEVTLVGSRYTPPASGIRILNFSNAIVNLDGGNFEASVATAATLSTRNVLSSATTNKLTFRFNLGNGSFSGSFIHPANHRKSSLRGIALQQANEARGFFPGTNQTGGVAIQGD